MKNPAHTIMQRADVLAAISATPGQVTRTYLSPEHRLANDQLSAWMQQAGLETWQDSVGNQWGRKVSAQPTKPTLILGSHSDTVINAGKYDGNLGVLLAIETLAALAEESFLFHIDVVAFADEEGTRFNTTLIGSSAVAGDFDDRWLAIEDAAGISMRQAMQDFGLVPEQAGDDARSADSVQAYLEAHIEQGPVLENEDRAVGVVTAIAGAKRYQCSIEGMAGHAGTVPIDLRQDALCGAGEVINCIENFAQQQNIVATVGKCEVTNGAVNVIPAQADFTIDIRSESQQQLEDCCQQMLQQIDAICTRRKLAFMHQTIYQADAAQCAPALQQRWARAIENVTHQPARLLASGAGHDGLAISKLTDIGMLFIRCEKGISHHPAEQVQSSDVDIALKCFVEMVRSFNA